MASARSMNWEDIRDRLLEDKEMHQGGNIFNQTLHRIPNSAQQSGGTLTPDGVHRENVPGPFHAEIERIYSTFDSTNNIWPNSNIREEIVFGENSDFIYWLVSRALGADASLVSFRIGGVGPTVAHSGPWALFWSSVSSPVENSHAYGVRPVIYLNSNVRLQLAEGENSRTNPHTVR